jgi:beta-glucosidase-like glycosyl hydrolase
MRWRRRALPVFYTPGKAAVRAITSGVDMILAAGTTSRDATLVSKGIYVRLLLAAKTHELSTSTLASAYRRVITLKHQLGP